MLIVNFAKITKMLGFLGFRQLANFKRGTIVKKVQKSAMRRYLLLWTLMFVQIPIGYSGELPVPNTFGTNFSLDSTLDKKVSLSDYKGKFVLLNFGYTSCPDVCPMVLSRLAKLNKEVKGSDRIQVLFISFDQTRDTIPHLKNYLNFFNPQFVGMNGPEIEIKNIFKRFGGVFSADKPAANNTQTFSHSDYIYLINEEGFVVGFYSSQDPYETVLEAVKKHL